MRVTIGQLLRMKREENTVTNQPTGKGHELLAEVKAAEQAGDKAKLSSLFTQARTERLQVVQREVTDALGRLLRGEPAPGSEPKPTANPVKALSPERRQAIADFKASKEQAEKKALIKEYCTIMKQDSWIAGSSLSLADLRAKIRSARKASHRHVGGGKKNGLCGGKQKKAKASNKKK